MEKNVPALFPWDWLCTFGLSPKGDFSRRAEGIRIVFLLFSNEMSRSLLGFLDLLGSHLGRTKSEALLSREPQTLFGEAP